MAENEEENETVSTLETAEEATQAYKAVIEETRRVGKDTRSFKRRMREAADQQVRTAYLLNMALYEGVDKLESHLVVVGKYLRQMQVLTVTALTVTAVLLAEMVS
jgi:hypothetical protein